MVYTKAAIAKHFATVSEGYNEHAAKVSKFFALQSIAAAKQISSAYLAGLSNTPRGWSEFMLLQTSELQRELEARKEMLRQVAEIDTPHLLPLDIGLSLDAFSALGALSDKGTISNQHIPARVHALPSVPSRGSSSPWSLPEATASNEHGEHLLSATSSFLFDPETPEEGTARLEHSLDDNRRQKLLGQLKRFVEKEDIRSDARDGVSVMLTWWKLNRSLLSRDESREFNLMVLDFLRRQPGLPTSLGSHQERSSGLLVPRLNNQDEVVLPDLEPRKYTSKELAEHLSYDEATIRRKAAASWQEGAGAQPLKGIPDWYVVGRGNNDGGRRCGWKFQQRRRADGS